MRMTGGNQVRLLENGEEFFPRVNEAIAAAQREVLIETFILADDSVGRALRDQLIAAARRGVRTQITVDGYGTAELPADFMRSMTEAGVTVRWFDPRPSSFGVRTNLFRRLHRKLVVIDSQRAFVGGLNFSVEHLREYGAESKQDYAVEVEGPVVAQVRQIMGEPARKRWHFRRGEPVLNDTELVSAGGMQAALVQRDNGRHSQDIETIYRIGIRSARREIVIANAYFLPGYHFLRELRRAARRGVDVHLILQGRPDMRAVQWATGTLHNHLLRAGVHIHEYTERPLHGKVAVIDNEWATVGSSNLDPLSLSLNLEANLVVQDRGFATALRQKLGVLIEHQCRELKAPAAGPSTLLRNAIGVAIFHILRWLPQWAGWLPAHGEKRILPHAAIDPIAEA
jgi:cardiolipin synthase